MIRTSLTSLTWLVLSLAFRLESRSANAGEEIWLLRFCCSERTSSFSPAHGDPFSEPRPGNIAIPPPILIGTNVLPSTCRIGRIALAHARGHGMHLAQT